MGNAALAEELKKAPMAPEETSFLHETGEALGLGAGVAVTEVLALLPSWREPVLDKDGKPAASVPGADRIGEHEIQKRHQQVVGPQIAKFAQKLPPGMLKDFVAGFGLGASEGPGASYRLEAGIADMF